MSLFSDEKDVMTQVNSVLGPIDTAKISFTLMHKHLVVASASTRGMKQTLMVLFYIKKVVFP